MEKKLTNSLSPLFDFSKLKKKKKTPIIHSLPKIKIEKWKFESIFKVKKKMHITAYNFQGMFGLKYCSALNFLWW